MGGPQSVSRVAMRFDQPLEPATLIRRYKRFLADVRLHGSGEETTVHCPNPGAMLGLHAPGSLVWLQRSFSPTRKLPLTLEIVEADGGLVGVDTMLPNKLVAEALAADAIPELTGYSSHRREVKYGEASRIDFLLEGEGRPACWLEVKNCHLMRTPGLAEFPDCRAARSSKHLRELTAMKAAGDRAVVLFTVQRMDCDRFTTADELDPAFGQDLRDAVAAGVELLIYGCNVAVDEIAISHPLRVC
jgi:sugar fermentation stimulation protein A